MAQCYSAQVHLKPMYQELRVSDKRKPFFTHLSCLNNQDQLIAAMDGVLKDSMFIRGAVEKYGIPRTTLRHHLGSGSRTKIKGRKPILK
ncbi:hypothetical protein PR048_025154 [Dryococelus australis]|uniref:HTH psq-type domain-containing protein n=1 Tax=Dryococelus australis TaxID=614101 RepID=A0ABQ9GQK9_9NEOP|nr:hypothetical protein PR048_025154 [Dryococelus australis]